MKLLSIGNDSKTVKGEQFGYKTGIVYMAPSNESEVTNTCRYASKGCRSACLYTAGRGAMSNVQQARIRKTKYWFQTPSKFVAQLNDEIRKESAKAKRQGFQFAVRLNGTSDIAWEAQTVIHDNPNIQFYDYTKNWRRVYAYLDGRNRLPNYDLTFSRSESNDEHCETILRRGGRVAMVFSDLAKVLPSDQKPEDHTYRYGGEYWPIWNGDLSDVRFNDPLNGIVALQAKGKGKKTFQGLSYDQGFNLCNLGSIRLCRNLDTGSNNLTEPIMNYIAYFQNMITHYISDSESDVWTFVEDQEDPSDYTVHCVAENELDDW